MSTSGGSWLLPPAPRDPPPTGAPDPNKRRGDAALDRLAKKEAKHLAVGQRKLEKQ